MKYNELSVNKAKAPKRVGRGIAAGQGKTAGRGTKGQNSRTGSSRRPGFEGGQNPLMQRIPKLHGFRSSKVRAEVVYTGQLETLKAKAIDAAVLAEAGLISNGFVRVKLVVNGDLTVAKTVKLQAASATAIAAIEKAGGSFEAVARPSRPAAPERKSRKAKREEQDAQVKA
jgi:large subunit ribosomal protein L15